MFIDNQKKVQAATQEMMSAIDDYRIKDNNATQNLINSEEIDTAITTAMVAFCKEYIDTANDITLLQTNTPVRHIFNQLLIDLRDYVFTGKTKWVKDENGKPTEVAQKTSPKQGDPYYNQIIKTVMSHLLISWQPKTPTLKHNPNAKRFLEICRDLCPNVSEPHKAANGLRTFIENVHHSCNTPDAKHTQRALWLVSQETGGTGKSFLIEMLQAACDELGIENGCETLQDSGYLNPTIGLHTVTICKDTKYLNSSLAELMNNLIDHDPFAYNIKFGAQGQARSVTTMIIGSNYVSFLKNNRRYAEVPYYNRNVETSITDEDRKAYFPFWNNKAQGIREIIEAFEVCPFKCEHDPWEPPLLNNDLFDEGAKPTVNLDIRYVELVMEIKDTIAAFNDDPCRKGDLTKMYPTAFAKLMTHYNNKLNYKETLAHLKTFLIAVRDANLIPTRNCQGLTPVEACRYNWKTFAALAPAEDDDPRNFLTKINEMWNALIANEITNEIANEK